MQSVSTSRWRHEDGVFSELLRDLPICVALNRKEKYVNLNVESKIKEIELLGYKNGDILLSLTLKEETDAAALLTIFQTDFPEIRCLAGTKQLTIRAKSTEGDLFNQLNRALETINGFEAIEPLAVFVQMKKALGIDLAESEEVYARQIQSLYRGAGNFDAALELALRCEKAGYPGLVHSLAVSCIERGDYMNAIKAISHETDLEPIYALAQGIFLSEDVRGIASSKEKLEVALKLFDLCGSLNDAHRFKAQIFSELAGESFDPVSMKLALAGELHGDALCRVAHVLSMKNQEIAKLKAGSPRSDSGAASASSGGLSGVVGGFSGGTGGASAVSRSDATTQTIASTA